VTDIDRIVDVITRRVEEELARRVQGGGGGGGQQPHAPCTGCSVRGGCQPTQVIGSVNAGAARLSAARTGADAGMESPPCAHVAPLIDHTLLKPEASRDELRKVCDEARKYTFASVCVNSCNVRFVANALRGTVVKPIAVVGFPLGAATSGAKAFETREAIREGAQEIDMVVNIGAMKSRDYAVVIDDIKAVVKAAGAVPVKVILETSKLDDEEKAIACALAKAAGAAFVKTSTGFGGGGATPEDVALMRRVVGDELGVKASGGIRTIDDAERVIEAGATRIGASASVAIVKCVKTASKKGY